MKKFISLLICAAICLCAFTACSKKAEAAPLNEIYASLQDVSNMPEMALMPDNLVETFFGFDLSLFEEYIFAEAYSPDVNADVIILIKLKDNANLNSTVEVLDGYLSSVKSYTESYSPVNFAKAEKAAVKVSDNYIYLIITSELFEAEQVVINGLGN